MLFPIYWMFITSLKLPEEIFKSPQFGNYAILFTDGDVWSLWNSFVIAGVSTPIAMVLGTLCAYAIWMMRGDLRYVPVELEEAALVDGHSHLSVVWNVTVPMARNGIIATAIFTFIFSWNEFLFGLVLTRTEVITSLGAVKGLRRCPN